MSEDMCVMCGEYIPEGCMVCYKCEKAASNTHTIKTVVFLNKITDVKDFVNLASMCRGDVVIKDGRYAINAKSIMALFSLDLTKPLEVEFYGNVPCEVSEGVKKFIVN